MAAVNSSRYSFGHVKKSQQMRYRGQERLDRFYRIW